ncbi:MAG: restriction endonuclease [Bacteroidota bacterium]|nr:restriction endonuclease [Bacteroidota bacterium]
MTKEITGKDKSKKDAGKAFEYALINEATIILSENFQINLITDTSYKSAEASFNLYNDIERKKYQLAASIAISHIIRLEPKLTYNISTSDILQLQLMPDAAGQAGDVRDILFIRSNQNWEIGISAKNNHKALKHSRLSNIKDFGKDWVGVKCRSDYFSQINPIFRELQYLKGKNELWKNVTNKHTLIYMPVLNAFKEELLFINKNNPYIPEALVSYLLGKHDFYKVIKGKKRVEILGFNINGTLNRTIKNKPLNEVQRLKLPTEIIRFEYKPNSRTTLLLVCNEGWQISFRLHSAETAVVASLKFDSKLIGHPESLYSHHISY